MESIRSQVIAIYDDEGYEPDANGDVETGVSDSLDAMHLMMRLEDDFEVEFPDDVEKTLFLNVDKTAKYIEELKK